MPAALIERKKMTRATYQALKRHILRERVKRKQEQEADMALERQRRELEKRKRQEKENKNSLQKTKDEIVRLKQQLEDHKKEKSKLFGQLKRLLETESTKKENEKKNDPQQFPLGQSGPTTQPIQFLSGTGHMGRPVLYKPALHPGLPQSQGGNNRDAPQSGPAKRARSPSPIPKHVIPNVFQFDPEFNNKLYGHQSSQPPTGQVKPGPNIHGAGQPSPSMYGGNSSKYNQTTYQPYLHGSHGAQNASQLLPGKAASDSFSGRSLGQRLNQTVVNPVLTEETQHIPNLPPTVHHPPPAPKGGIMSGYPVQSNSSTHQPPPPMMHGSQNSDRNPYHRDYRNY